MLSPTTTWAIAIGLSSGPAVSNGLARFAYGLILPAMHADLDWSYTQAGWINTANALGYLVGALLTFALLDQTAPRRLFVIGMIIMPLSLAGSSAFIDPMLQSAFRIAAGIGGAATFISGGAMVSTLFRDDPSRNALAISLYFGGGGVGMVASGAVIPILIDCSGNEAWSSAWLFLAATSALLAIPSLFAANACPQPAKRTISAANVLPISAMAYFTASYFLFAVGYIVYLTFLVPLLYTKAISALLVSMAWSLMGVAVMIAPIFWRGILSRSLGGGALALSCLATGMATLLLLLLPGSVPALVLSVTIFGLSCFMAPTAVTSFVKKNCVEHLWGRTVAMFTAIFALGQIIGPLLAGVISDATGELAYGMAAAGIILLVGATSAFQQRPFSRLLQPI